MTVLLTGATGFLGSHLLEKLLHENYNVLILKRNRSNLWRINKLIHKVKVYNIDEVAISKPFKEQKVDIVIHTATNYGRENNNISNVLDTNLMFSIKLLETAIHFNTDTFFNTDTLSYKYLNSYSLSKKQFTEWLEYFSDKIQVVNLKLEHIYGPKDDNTKFVTWLINQLLQNIPNIDLTEGKQKRDFIYIDDVVEAYIVLLKSYKSLLSFSEFDVGTGNQVELRDFILQVYNEVHKIKPTKAKLNFGAIPYRPGEPMKVEEDVGPLYKLGWKPKTSLTDGIKKTVKEFLYDQARRAKAGDT